jgi:hypothetical protein
MSNSGRDLLDSAMVAAGIQAVVGPILTGSQQGLSQTQIPWRQHPLNSTGGANPVTALFSFKRSVAAANNA